MPKKARWGSPMTSRRQPRLESAASARRWEGFAYGSRQRTTYVDVAVDDGDSSVMRPDQLIRESEHGGRADPRADEGCTTAS